MDPTARALSPKEFFEALPGAVKTRLRPGQRGFHSARLGSRLVKIHYGEPDLHFEGWHHAGAGRFEVGLHSEADRSTNLRRFEALRQRMVELKGSLPRAELEPWDRGWCRLYETFPAAVLDGRVLAEAADRLAAYIAALQPILGSLR